MGNDFVGQDVGGFRRGVEDQFRLQRRFVGIVDAGEALEFAGGAFL